MGVSERAQTLRRCVQEASRRQGIERDPATHTRPSPTVRTVMLVLEEVVADPAEFGYELAVEQEAVREEVRSLLVDLRPSFSETGDLGNLARETGFDFGTSVLYLDL